MDNAPLGGGELAAALAELSGLARRSDPHTGSVHGGAGVGLSDQTRLYEAWLRREQWSLRREGIPLLLGVSPECWQDLVRRDAALSALEQRVWGGLKTDIANRGLPTILDWGQPEERWQVKPSELYHWATGIGMGLPEPFEVLIQFILRVIKPTLPAHGAIGPSQPDGALPRSNSSAREKVLGAALNILAKCPERCLDEHGFVSGEAIGKLIREQSMRWFDAPEPPLQSTDMAALIDKWLE